MSDDVDSANDNILLINEALVSRARKALPEAQATGECLYCTELLAEGKRWCDTDCRDGWEREKRRGR